MEQSSMRKLGANTQLGRVIAIMCDGRERTLRDIENACWNQFGEGDTQAAISARLREVHSYGWEKQARLEVIHGKQVWRYRLVPFNSKAQSGEVAA